MHRCYDPISKFGKLQSKNSYCKWNTCGKFSLVFLSAPHQPRLDWQIWFAALGSYEYNPWFVHLVFRLLQGQQDVLDLLAKNPFPDRPPTYVRAWLYKYHYTKLPTNISSLTDVVHNNRLVERDKS